MSEPIHQHDFMPKTGITTPSGQRIETYGKQWLVTKDALEDEELDLGAQLSKGMLEEIGQAGYTAVGPVELTVTEPAPNDPIPEEWESLTPDQLPRYVRATVKVAL